MLGLLGYTYTFISPWEKKGDAAYGTSLAPSETKQSLQPFNLFRKMVSCIMLTGQFLAESSTQLYSSVSMIVATLPFAAFLGDFANLRHTTKAAKATVGQISDI